VQVSIDVRHLLNPYKCPNCNEPTISFWTKQFLGPARSIRCRNCEAKISVGWKTSLISVPLLFLHFLVILVVGLEVWSRYGIPAAFAGIVLVSVPFCVLFEILQHRFVKLIVRDA